jgi:hypothetical protein
MKYGEKDIIINYMKYLIIQISSVTSQLKKLAWAGHLTRMDDNRTLKENI